MRHFSHSSASASHTVCTVSCAGSASDSRLQRSAPGFSDLKCVKVWCELLASCAMDKVLAKTTSVDDAKLMARPRKPPRLGRTASGAPLPTPVARPRAMTCGSVSSRTSTISSTSDGEDSCSASDGNASTSSAALSNGRLTSRDPAGPFDGHLALSALNPAFGRRASADQALPLPPREKLADRARTLDKVEETYRSSSTDPVYVTDIETGPETSASQLRRERMARYGTPHSVGTLISLVEQHEISFPVTATVAGSSSAASSGLPVGQRVALCGTHENVTAQLVDSGQCIAYEAIDSPTANRTVYEVVRGGMSVGSAISFLWGVETYSCLRNLLLSTTGNRRRIRMAADAVLDDDVELKRGDEMLIACDEMVADASSTTHAACWKLPSNRKDAAGHPWEAVELIMLPMDAQLKLNVCVNSELLRMRDIHKKSYPLPLQLTAYECVATRPEPYAMSGFGGERLRLSTSSRLTLQAFHSYKSLIVATDTRAVLLSDTSPVQFLLDEQCGDIHVACSVLAHIAGTQLSWQQSAMLTALPITSSSLELLSATSAHESIYVDMSGTGYLHFADSMSHERHQSTGSAEYYSVSVAKARRAIAEGDSPITTEAPQLPPRPSVPLVATAGPVLMSQSSTETPEQPKAPPRTSLAAPPPVPVVTPDGYVDLRQTQAGQPPPVDRSKKRPVPSPELNEEIPPSSPPRQPSPDWRPVPIRTSVGNQIFASSTSVGSPLVASNHMRLHESISEDPSKVLQRRRNQTVASFDDHSLSNEAHSKIYAPSVHPSLRVRINPMKDPRKRMSRDDLDLELSRRPGNSWRASIDSTASFVEEPHEDGLTVRGREYGKQKKFQMTLQNPKTSPRKRTGTSLRNLFKTRDKPPKMRATYQSQQVTKKSLPEEPEENDTPRSRPQRSRTERHVISPERPNLPNRFRTETSSAALPPPPAPPIKSPTESDRSPPVARRRVSPLVSAKRPSANNINTGSTSPPPGDREKTASPVRPPPPFRPPPPRRLSQRQSTTDAEPELYN